ncbi:hypothetical protein BGX29_009768 [Mortierella sp. GBA35]|nr:hypothetical protein BGX23_006912 [Mortierella sp. AD031]KAF9106351.1 hypothetical protein BGX29_009768 [Mortierella sp. GBA35]KAG0207887.1 hypothetical protein BGX33_006552 [Mortierella sp. NVP41]
MIPVAGTLTLLSALALASTVYADVLSTNPVEGTHWTIGEPASIKWTLTSPTSKKDKATIYLVGGDYKAYQRLETLDKEIVLGENKHSLKIEKVPDVKCKDTCAIEFVVVDKDGNSYDYYSHNFTISAAGDTPSATAVADKSAPVVAGSNQNAATPNGPITLVQNAAKGAQSHATTSSAPNVHHMGTQGLAAVVLAAAATAISFALF